MTRRGRTTLMGELKRGVYGNAQSEHAADAMLSALVLDRHNLNDVGHKAGLAVCIREAVRGAKPAPKAREVDTIRFMPRTYGAGSFVPGDRVRAGDRDATVLSCGIDSIEVEYENE